MAGSLRSGRFALDPLTFAPQTLRFTARIVAPAVTGVHAVFAKAVLELICGALPIALLRVERRSLPILFE